MKLTDLTYQLIVNPDMELNALLLSQLIECPSCIIFENKTIVSQYFAETKICEENKENNDNKIVYKYNEYTVECLYCDKIQDDLRDIIKKNIAIFVYHFKKNDITSTSKSNFLANISHEIKTPLNGIVGCAQLLKHTELSTTQQNHVMRLNDCCVQLMRIINDVMDYSKLKSGNFHIREDCFKLDRLINMIKEATNDRFVKRNQVLIINSPEDLIYIITDLQKILQILVNLITNASKYSSNNTKIIINFTILGDNTSLKIDVIDNGIGISKSNQQKLFRDFFQIRPDKDGSGLGLAICKKLVTLLKGTINVKSKVGIGSTFTVILPLEGFTSYERRMLKEKHLVIDHVVLVVDDTLDSRMLLNDYLCEWGMKPVIFVTPIEALQYISSSRFLSSIGVIDTTSVIQSSMLNLAKKIKLKQPMLPLIALVDKKKISITDSCDINKYFDHIVYKPYHKIQLFSAIYKTIQQSNFSRSIIKLQKSPRLVQKKIMIVEDVKHNQEVLYDMLKLLNFNDITIVNNGEEALLKMSEIMYNIIFIDLKMPIMDGYKLIQSMDDNVRKQTDLIVVTASIKDSDETFCKEHNVDYLIRKPIQFEELNGLLLCL